MTRKGVGKVRFLYPIDSQLNITIDVMTTHLHSDATYTGQVRQRRVNQLNQILPAIETSDADLVIFGGDFNDIPNSGLNFRIVLLEAI